MMAIPEEEKNEGVDNTIFTPLPIVNIFDHYSVIFASNPVIQRKKYLVASNHLIYYFLKYS